MAKRHVTITMEDYVHEQCKGRGINISAICEDTLRQIIETFDKPTLFENCDHNWTFPFSVPWGLAKQCKRCGAIKKVITETYEKTMERAGNPSNAQINT